jgi:diacylglycerol kinase (ATP)
VNPLVVVNPRAGGGRAGRVFGEMKPILERALGAIDVTFTERGAHAIEIARDAANAGRELIVAVGGDGTLHEVANGVLDAGNDTTAVGFIGQGTGGDFRRSLGLEHRLDHYLAAIASGRERRIDVGRATFHDDDGREASRWFVNVLSAGIGGLVDRYVAGANRAMGASVTYAVATVRALASFVPVPVAFTLHRGDAREELIAKAFVLAVCNGTTVGAGMRLAPMAKVDDGRFEVIVMAPRSKLAFAAYGSKMYDGTHLGEPGVACYSCDAIDVAIASGPKGHRVLLDIDGEPLGALPLRIAMKPRALRFRA